MENGDQLRDRLTVLNRLVLGAERDRTKTRQQKLRFSRVLRSEARHVKARLLRFERFDKEPLVVVVG